jgi:superfamily II DNA or RNA helicase
MMNHKPEIATNRSGDTVAAALATYWQQRIDDAKQPPALALATAYFNPGGFGLLADQLERSASVRLLLGAEPDVAADMRRPRTLRNDTLPSMDGSRRVRDALRSHAEDMATDRNLTHFDRAHDRLIERLIGWLRSGKVEVRRLESRFLHGKAFVVETHHDGVLAGSSNLTYAGLRTNVELNLGQYQPHVVGEVLDWYDELWAEAVDYDLAGLYEQRFAEWDPYVVYLRMLWERYRDDLHDDPEPPGLELTEFQRDGLYRSVDFLRRHNGVIIADGVGLGKTWLAGELIRQAVEDRRQRVLLVAPAALRDGPWERFLRDHNLKNVQVVSFQELAMDNRVGGTSPSVLWHDPDDYAMVVIDEAHAYRNTDTERAATLRRLLKGSPQKQLVLLTATPVNNSLWDLYNLLAYFIRNDGKFLEIGVPSLRTHFAQAAAADPDDLTPDRLFDILDAVAVRRTRRFIKKFYPHATIKRDGRDVPITFPQPVVHRVEYDLDSVLPGLFAQLAHALGMDPEDPDTPIPDTPTEFSYGGQLSLARYAPSAFRHQKNPDAYELHAAGLLRSGLLKRFESSTYAFARTCRKMARSHETFLEALNDGWVLTGDSLAAWEKTDSDDFDPGKIANDLGGTREPATDYDTVELRVAVEGDRDLLVEFAERAESVANEADPKLDSLVTQLAQIADEARREGIGDQDARDKRKVLIFSYYADTVDWIVRRLKAASASDERLRDYLDRVTFVSGSQGSRQRAMWGFAPISSEAPAGTEDAYDCLIATDVLAEGVNLQQARHIINYDLPWNPMRLVQRHGRIDRIGSPHARVHLRCFFPSALLDELLGLEAALQRKIAQAAASVGVEDEIIPGSKRKEVVLHHTHAQIEALRAEDPSLFESAEDTGALSGEEFRRELADRMADSRWAAQVENLPWAAGSGRAVDGPGGYVFCARVGNHPLAVHCYVPLGEDGHIDVEGITNDSLTALSRATCTQETERVLPDATRELAYDAWEEARAHIAEKWLREADPRALSQPVPKAMRDAANILRNHPPEGTSSEQLYPLLDAIEAPYDPRTQRLMRSAINSSNVPRKQATAIVDLVRELALAPPGAVEPRPEIELDDVHLVCWMALCPRKAGAVRA